MENNPVPQLSPQHSVLSTVPWKRISKLLFWLWGFPPAGLWMLWRDQTLNRSMKWRVLIYAVVIPALLSIAFMLYEFDAAEKAIQAGGGGF